MDVWKNTQGEKNSKLKEKLTLKLKNQIFRRSSCIYQGHQFYGVMVDEKTRPSYIQSTSCTPFTSPANVHYIQSNMHLNLPLGYQYATTFCFLILVIFFKKTAIRNIPFVLEGHKHKSLLSTIMMTCVISKVFSGVLRKRYSQPYFENFTGEAKNNFWLIWILFSTNL